MTGVAPRRGAFTLVELAVSLAIIAVVLSILLPALSSARVIGQREQCAANQRLIGSAWNLYLEEYRQQFPYISAQPAWRWGGVRFSPLNDRPFLDLERPISRYIDRASPVNRPDTSVFRCPADAGITDVGGMIGTAERTAFRAFGTSYRANACLLNARLCGLDGERRGLHVNEVLASPHALVLMGDAVWYEALEQTGRTADWHAAPSSGNILFLDGSVRFTRITPARRGRTLLVDPLLRRDDDARRPAEAARLDRAAPPADG